MVELREIVQRLRLGQSVKAIHRDTGRHKTVIRAVRDLALREGWLDVRTEIPSEGEIARLYGEAMIVVTLTYDPAACTGCGRCWEVCPHGVFMPDSDRVNGGKALLTDRDLCMECGACEANCRFGAIKGEKRRRLRRGDHQRRPYRQRALLWVRWGEQGSGRGRRMRRGRPSSRQGRVGRRQ